MRHAPGAGRGARTARSGGGGPTGCPRVSRPAAPRAVRVTHGPRGLSRRAFYADRHPRPAPHTGYRSLLPRAAHGARLAAGRARRSGRWVMLRPRPGVPARPASQRRGPRRAHKAPLLAAAACRAGRAADCLGRGQPPRSLAQGGGADAWREAGARDRKRAVLHAAPPWGHSLLLPGTTRVLAIGLWILACPQGGRGKLDGMHGGNAGKLDDGDAWGPGAPAWHCLRAKPR